METTHKICQLFSNYSFYNYLFPKNYSISAVNRKITEIRFKQFDGSLECCIEIRKVMQKMIK